MKPRFAVLALLALLPTTAAAQQTLPLPARLSTTQAQPLPIQVEPQGRHGLRFNRHFGAEAEPAPTGSAFVHGLERERELQQGGSSYGVAYLPLSSKTDVFARAGYGTTDLTQVHGRIPDEGSWRLGVGAHYSPSPNEGLRADFTRHDFRTSRIKANIVSFGYARRF